MRFAIYSKDGIEKCHANTIEYQGKWMGESFVHASVQSAEPIDFELGDYLVYNGQKFEINYDPAVIKRARAGSVGDAFKYENIKFNSFSDELTRCRFLDFVSGDNNLHYSFLPKFSFFCADIKDFMMRIQANLDRMYKDWKIEIVPGTECATNVQIDIDNKSVWEALESITTKFKSSFVVRMKKDDNGKDYKAIIIGEEVFADHDVLQYGKGNGLKQIERSSNDSQQIITRLRAYGSTKNLPYHYYTGTVDSIYGNTYTYDPWFAYPRRKKGDDVATAFGYVLYQDPTHFQGKVIVKVSLQGPFTINDRHMGIKFYTKGNPSVVRTADLNFSEYEQNLVREYLDDEMYVGASFIYEFPSEEDFQQSQIMSDNGGIVVMSGIQKSILRHYKWIWYAPYPLAPSTMSVNNLMLPDFLALTTIQGQESDSALHLDVESEKAIYDANAKVMLNPANCKAVYASDNVTVKGYWYSDGNYYRAVYYRDETNNYQLLVNYDSYIEDADAVAKYGIREGCVFFDSEDADNDISEIYPTLQGMKAENARNAGYVIDLPYGDNGYLDEVLSGTDASGIRPVTDDGVPDDHSTAKTEPDNFTIYVKDLGFNPHDYLSTDNMKIRMRSGMCGEREFELVDRNNNPKRVWLRKEHDRSKYVLLDSYEDGAVPAYEFICVRSYDDALGLYFPNKDYPINGMLKDEVRPEDGEDIGKIWHSDRFTIFNIELPRLYVDTASQLLLKSAYAYLANNIKTKLTYSPVLDPVYIAKDRDHWKSIGQEEKSLHYALKEGCMLRFKDEDLDVFNGINTKLFIDTITIKEGSGVVPEYTISLKEEKEFTTLQKMQNQITAVAGASASSLTAEQARIIAKTVVTGNYLSKKNDDTAEGTIRFNKSVILDNGFHTRDFIPGLSGGTGAALLQTEQGTRMELDYLSIRKRLEALEVQIQKMSHIGGQAVLSAASAELTYVLYNAKNNVYRCFFDAEDGEGNEITNDWKVGDQARCQTFNLAKDADGYTRNRYWWRLVTAVSDNPAEMTTEGGSTVKRHWFDVYGGNDNAQKADTMSGMPAIGDSVTLLGHQGTDESRKNAIIEAGAGTDSPYHRQYKGIDKFSITPDNLKIDLNPVESRLKVEHLDIISNGRFAPIAEYVESSTTDAIEKQLDQKFDIWQLTEHEAPLNDEGEIVTPLSMLQMAGYDSRLLWTGTEAEEHVGDFVLFGDGVCYQFTERYEWHLISDTYLISYVEQLVEQRKKISDMESDSKVTPMEKQQLLTLWNQEKSEHDEIINPGAEYLKNANVLSKRVAYNTIYNAVDNALTRTQGSTSGGILYDLTTTTDLTTFVWPSQFSSISEAFAKLDTAKAAYKKALTDFAKDNGAAAAEKYVTESGLTIDNLSATLWSTLKDSSGKLVSQAIAETYVTQEGLSGFRVAADHIDFSSSVMNLQAGQFTITSDNFNIDADGIATVRGLVKKGHLAINTPEEFIKYFVRATDPLSRKFYWMMDMSQKVASANYIEIGFMATGDLTSQIFVPYLNGATSDLTQAELESIRDYIGQQVVIYNNTNYDINICGLFFTEGYWKADPSNPNIGQWMPPSREYVITLSPGYVAALECKAVRPEDATLLDESDRYSELIWWKPYLARTYKAEQ